MGVRVSKRLKVPTNAIDAFHWVPESRQMNNLEGASGRKDRVVVVEPNTTYSLPPGERVIRCESGLHGSTTIHKVMRHTYVLRSSVGWLCRVKMWGNVDATKDKLATRHRHVVGMVRINLNGRFKDNVKHVQETAELLGWT